jgi:hypothetical protein
MAACLTLGQLKTAAPQAAAAAASPALRLQPSAGQAGLRPGQLLPALLPCLLAPACG